MQYILRGILSAGMAGLLCAATAWADSEQQPGFTDFYADQDDDGLIRVQFTQRGFEKGAKVRVRMWGRDDNGDGILYSMSGFLAMILPGPMTMGPGNEFIRVEAEFINFFGIPRFKQVWDERETPILQEPGPGTTMFFGFSYNLDGGMIGDDPNEGVSFSPLAPSVTYTMGELFQTILGPGFTELFSCGQEGSVCAAVTQLNAIPEPPGFELVNEAYSNDQIYVRPIKKSLPPVSD
jgi:hypothetical protein